MERTISAVNHALHRSPYRSRSNPRSAAFVWEILIIGHRMVAAEQDEADAILGGPNPGFEEAYTFKGEGVRPRKVLA
ncbi:MAG TPA: hypothetical protein VFX19_14155 [Dehalococcoidia bacterium]|jgi:hypothetical protein|nr:hypothetical protein [Dehalococcoidia bacterium]